MPWQDSHAVAEFFSGQLVLATVAVAALLLWQRSQIVPAPLESEETQAARHAVTSHQTGVRG